MKKNKTKQLIQKRLIAGFFRELLFFSTPIFIKFDSDVIESRIEEIIEPHARSKSTDRTLLLKVSNIDEISTQEFKTLNFSCALPHFVANWSAKVSSYKSNLLKTTFPKNIDIQNNRANLRVSTEKSTTNIEMPVLIRSENLHTEGFYKIENISHGGSGGTLKTASKIPISANATLLGHFNTANGHIRISGEIKQISLLPENNVGETCYRIGLKNNNIRSKIINNTQKERRKFRRYNINESIELTSPLNPEHPIKVALENVSVTGFKCKILSINDLKLLPPGIGVNLANSTMVAEVVTIKNETIHFLFTSGTIDDRLDWLKRITASFNEHANINIGLSQELLSLFCESGAIASGFIKQQKRFSEAFLDGFGKNTYKTTWLHRWIETAPNGSVRGHFSSIRYADNMWMLGDLAGSSSEKNKLSKKFIPNFCDSFREFSISLSPCPKILFGWNHKHPYWRKFEEYLNKNKREVLATGYTEYFRAKPHQKSSPSNAKVTLVSASDYLKIKDTYKSLKNPSALEFLKSFDFQIDTFGSPTVKHSIIESGQFFDRCYLLVEYNNHKLISIVTKMPFGLSPNRTVDMAWIIPITARNLNKKTHEEVQDAIKLKTLELGFSIPGYLFLTNEKQSGGEHTKLMRWDIIHPNLLNWFMESFK